MSLTLIGRKAQKAKNPKVLLERIDYLEDSLAPSHEGKNVYSARNYNCPGPEKHHFSTKVNRIHHAYVQSKVHRPGPKSERLFEEVVYSTPNGADLSEQERIEAEKFVIMELAQGTAARTAWHHNTVTGRADLHVLIAAQKDDYPPSTTLWGKFGNGRKYIYSLFDELDERIARHINLGREPAQHITWAKEVRRDRQQASSNRKTRTDEEIGEMLASTHPSACLQTETLPNLLDECGGKQGFSVSRCTPKTISLSFAGKPRRYKREELLMACIRAQGFGSPSGAGAGSGPSISIGGGPEKRPPLAAIIPRRTRKTAPDLPHL